ncbi:MAG: succinate dehydrogenase [Gemmatimonadetes bacterium]|nr:MAG: succinate dehydrogenase [Gemmatimonadota bacterium]
MTTSVRDLQERSFGATLRRDAWWIAPALTALVLGSFAVYATWAAWVNRYYEWGPYLSPFYSPLIQTTWWPLSPAFLILIFPGAFRATCYYYRKAYYRAFFLDPVACGVGEPRHGYKGETRFPFILQNLHRYAMYAAVVFIFILSYDVFLAMRWPVNGVLADGTMAPGPREFGVGIGTLAMLVNVVLLSCYTFGCHSLRHLVGGNVNCFSCVRGGRARFEAWRGVSALNRHHMLFAWCSLFSVGLTDVYIRLCAMGVIHDMRLF